MNSLTRGEFLLIAVAAFAIPIPVNLVVRGVLEQSFTSANSIVYYCLARYASVGILEESYKVGITNLVAMSFLWLFRKKWPERVNKVVLFVIVFVAGSLAVAFWASRHPYGFRGNALVFVTGMIYFMLILWKKNYLPVIAAHMVNDWVLFLLLFTVFGASC